MAHTKLNLQTAMGVKAIKHFLVMVILMTMNSCGFHNYVTGSWIIIEMELNHKNVNTFASEIVFNKNTTCSLPLIDEGTRVTGNWNLQNNTLKISDTETFYDNTYTVQHDEQNSKITLASENCKLVLYKIALPF